MSKFKVGDQVHHRSLKLFGTLVCLVPGNTSAWCVLRDEYPPNKDGWSNQWSELYLDHVTVPEPVVDTYVAKRDAGKPQFDLLEGPQGCPDALLGLVNVLTWAVETKGYKPHSWRTVPDAIRRYSAARARHINAKNRGERHDPESGYLHDFHILACDVFIAQLESESATTRVTPTL